MAKATLLALVLPFLVHMPTYATINPQDKVPAALEDVGELNPYDADIMQQLFDNDLLEQQSYNDDINHGQDEASLIPMQACYRQGCPVFIEVHLAAQHAYLYVGGQAFDDFPISSGRPGHGTRRWDNHPNGPRKSGAYSSVKYPGGNWVNPKTGQKMGNMPYAVFYSGGFALHGTPSAIDGIHPLSHGCVRMPPFKAQEFNQLVAQYGMGGTWVYIH